ncbi:DMT family transporter [Aquimonas sp.]|jgi:drug/metabolite transporter (DMT)-like permease|uniref:DMT family transporter n=1 Tax=Aquimonas sp. TaxID=1872588 RepID=UPI0037C0B183
MTAQLHRSGLLLAAAGAILFSAKAILAKFQYRYGLDSLDVLTLRMLFAMPLFLLLGLRERMRGPGPRLSARERWVLLGIGLLGYYLSSLLDFWGLEYVPVSLERLILFLNPTFVLLIGLLFLGHTVSRLQWIAVAVSYAGIALVLAENLRVEGQHVLFGSALVLGAALSYALYLVGSGELVRRLGTARMVVIAMSISTAAICLHYLLVRDPARLLDWPAAAYGWALANAFFCTFLPVTFTMSAVRRVGPGIAAQLSVIGPVSLIFLGAWLLDEVITPLQILGTAVVLSAVWLLTRPRATPTQKPAGDRSAGG